MNREQLAARLRATFRAELEEQLRGLGGELLALEREPQAAERVHAVFRAFHTLKGAARAAGVHEVESTCHALETLLSRARDDRVALGPDELAQLFAGMDALADAARRLAEPSPAAAPAEPPEAEPPRAPAPAAAPPPEPAPAPAHRPEHASPQAPAAGAVTQAAPVFPPPSAREAAAPAEAAGEQVRVPAAGLDRLLASAGELTVASSRLETRAPELEVLRDSAAGLAREWQRLAHHVSAALERTGARPEVAGAVAGLGDELRRLAGAAEQAAAASRDDARRVTRAAAEVSDRAHRLRMRPFADACDALPRVVRDVARSAGKRARLEVRGGRVDADRAVIDALREILLHLVRNAVDHGIRAPEVRARAGKAEEGRVVVAAALRGDRLQVTVSDDGAGLNEAAVRGQLARRGLPVPDSPAALGRALFEAGFSTRDQADAISGRGVGLDAVRDAVARIRGSVEVTWEAGRGTTFHLECPVSLASVRVLLAEVDGQLLALPTAAVEHLERVQPERLRQAEGRPVLVGEGAPVPVVSLARVLGPPFAERPAERAAVAVRLAAGERRLAVVVDGLLAEQEVVVRPLERIRVPLRHVSGAALLAGGDVALVLDPAALLATGLAPGAGITLAGAPAQPARRRVLVVDDSVTTRTLEQSILEAAGCEVLTAVDGAEAWERLQDEPCDLVVSDVEMPRMDGFALCRAIRESRRFRTLPVVLVTALEHEEDRARGLEAGADAYLVKSSFDQQELLDTIRELVG